MFDDGRVLTFLYIMGHCEGAFNLQTFQITIIFSGELAGKIYSLDPHKPYILSAGRLLNLDNKVFKCPFLCKLSLGLLLEG